MTRQTLEQRRAQDAWTKAKRYKGEHMRLAKGLPALIMNSGLMQTMAFLHEKGGKSSQRHCRDVAEDLQRWLCERFEGIPDDFPGFMKHLMKAGSSEFQAINSESFAWLRWMRQMAAARNAGGD